MENKTVKIGRRSYTVKSTHKNMAFVVGSRGATYFCYIKYDGSFKISCAVPSDSHFVAL